MLLPVDAMDHHPLLSHRGIPFFLYQQGDAVIMRKEIFKIIWASVISLLALGLVYGIYKYDPTLGKEERAVLKAASECPRGELVIIKPIHLDADLSSAETQIRLPSQEVDMLMPKGLSLREAVEEFQKILIQRTLNKNSGNLAGAARDLGMHRSNLHNLATRLGLRAKKNIHRNENRI